jgi:hypothetical protein
MAHEQGNVKGLRKRVGADGKILWYVRLWHDGRERLFGSFPTKTLAKDFYRQAKVEQKQGRFFPERYQRGGVDLVEDILDAHTKTVTVKNHWAEKHYAA